MKVLLAGYEGSKRIIPASSWLINKYLPEDFDVQFLNFGDFKGDLFRGQFVSLNDVQHGGADSWASYLAGYIEKLDDEYVIFGLDDYLLASKLNRRLFDRLLSHMALNGFDCARLCISDFYPEERRVKVDKDLFEIKGGTEYACTTQYCIWRREVLLAILRIIRNPWQFEIEGSMAIGWVVCSYKPALTYPDTGSLSPSWGDKIRVQGNDKKDIEWLINKGYLEKDKIA